MRMVSLGLLRGIPKLAANHPIIFLDGQQSHAFMCSNKGVMARTLPFLTFKSLVHQMPLRTPMRVRL